MVHIYVEKLQKVINSEPPNLPTQMLDFIFNFSKDSVQYLAHVARSLLLLSVHMLKLTTFTSKPSVRLTLVP